MLLALVMALDDFASGHMFQNHAVIGLISFLAAWAESLHKLLFKVFLSEYHPQADPLL